MMTRFTEILVVVITLMVSATYVILFWTYSLMDIALLVSAWGVWSGALYIKSDRVQYVSAVCITLYIAFIIHIIPDNSTSPLWLALPPLIRAAILSSLPNHIRSGCALISLDVKRIANCFGKMRVDNNM